MILFVRILSMFLLLLQCDKSAQKSLASQAALSQSKPLNQVIPLGKEEVLSITYEALSRGAFYQVKIDKQLIEKFNDRSLKNSETKKCSQKEWLKIQSELEKINLEKMKELKVPSNKKSFDGAMHAKLIVVFPSQTFTSVNFDHGNPPEQIVPLVNTMLSLAESIE